MFALPLAPITAADIALAVLLGFILPLYTWIEHRQDQRREVEGRARSLVQRYRGTMLMLWGASALVVAAWIGAGRPLADLGLGASGGFWFFVALAAAIVGSLLYGAQVFTIRRNATARAELRDMLHKQQGVDSMFPSTPAQMVTFRWVALTAGITEELLFRGFLIWALAHWMPVWAAAALSLAIFTLAHLYQGTARALVGVLIAGGVMTALTLVSGSLLPAMILHIAVDLAGGEMTWAARHSRDDAEA